MIEIYVNMYPFGEKFSKGYPPYSYDYLSNFF